MIVDHSRCLHKRVANGRSDKPEAALLQVFAEGVGFGSFCRNTLVAFPAVLFGLPADEEPHERIESAVYLLHFQKGPRIRYHRYDFHPIAYDSYIKSQSE